MIPMFKWLKNVIKRRTHRTATREAEPEDDDITPTNTPFSTSENGSSTSSQMTIRQPIRIFAEDIATVTDQLICPVCDASLIPPIRFCRSGHSFCGTCSQWTTTCIICFEPMTKVSNQNLENIATWAGFFCPNMIHGCPERIASCLMSYHNKYCQYRIIKCPVNTDATTCAWQGTKMSLKSHINFHHRRQVCFCDVFFSKAVHYDCKVIYLEKEIFIFFKLLTRDYIWMIAVFQVGLTNRTYKTFFELDGNDGIYHMEVTKPVRLFTLPLMTYYVQGECLRVPNIFMEQFVLYREMGLKVKIIDVTAKINP